MELRTASSGSRMRENLQAHPSGVAGETQLNHLEDSRARRSVLFVTSTLGYGGSEKHVLELVRRLGDRGIQSVIMCAKTDPYTEKLTPGNYSNVTVHSASGLNSALDWFGFFRMMKAEAVVFVYGTLVDLPWFAPVAARLACGRSLYAIQHLIPPPLAPEIPGHSLRDALRRMIGKRARFLMSSRIPPKLLRKTICVSDAVRESLARTYGFPPDKMETVHNGVSLSKYVPSKKEGAAVREKLGIRQDDFVLVCVARLSWEKGIDILLKAMKQLANEHPLCKCIIVGEGYLMEELKEQANALNITARVFMVGFQEDVKPYLHAADAFVLTSHKEGLPFSVLEAMACGLPCVVTNVGGNAEAVSQNVTGLVVSPGSVDEVVQAVSFLITHPDERALMSQLARSKATAEFDIEARMTEIMRVILN